MLYFCVLFNILAFRLNVPNVTQPGVSVRGRGVTVEALLKEGTPRIVKRKQGLNVKFMELGRLLEKVVEQSLPLFQALKTHTSKNDITWLSKAEEAFQKLKQNLKHLITLARPITNEPQTIYLSASHEVISAVLTS